MKTSINTMVLFFFISLITNYAHSHVLTDVQKHYGDEQIHGLKYINDKAIEVIEAYNKGHNTHWESLEPDLRIIVARCLVPLKAKWAEYDPHKKLWNIPSEYWYVSVSCDKTVSDIPERKTWDIYVPTTRPLDPSQVKK
ncbi:hypothetical protein [Gilliamella sp. Pas-s25]|uniref:hypothetical protein n=1 Tax=Gilliamella sp. Pas-s25 TaxID=2687310 RepID=UPI00135E299A|nr:hypothetical protein [Gilliamella sp. Pas-s25]MWP63170.1 hypothetical protein [Gilliamella sp. Pas-s25]